MSQKNILLIVAVVLIGGSIWWVSQNRRATNEVGETPAIGTTTSPTSQAMPAPGYEGVEEMVVNKDGAMAIGSYEVYAPEKLTKATDGKVVLFFRASWCPTCKALDADIRANLAKIPAGVTILDVDYDKYVDLKKKYNVTYQHTMVQVDASGNQIQKWSGSPTLGSILEKI